MKEPIYACKLAGMNSPAKCNHQSKIGGFNSCMLPTKKHLATVIIKDACYFIEEYEISKPEETDGK